MTESIAEKTGMPDSVRTFSKKLTSDLSASQRLSSQLYIKGYEFVEALVRKKGMEGIKAAFESPPVSTAQILNPEDYFRPLKSHDIDYVKLFERIADNIAPDDMQTQTMGVGAMDLTSSLVLNGITQDEAFDIAKECIKGARFQATRPVAKPVSISLEIFDFKEAISAERLDETNRRIHESVINQIKASLNRSLDIIKEETLDLEGFNNVVFRHAVLKKVRTVTESVEAAGLMGSCYVSLKYENMEGITLDNAMKVLNMIHSEYSNLN